MNTEKTESINFEDYNDHIFNGLIIFLVIIIILIIYNIYNYNCNYNNSNIQQEVENMTAGTLTQLYANDQQDLYLKGNVDNLATGNFMLNWNQPSRLTDIVPNRGLLLVPNDNVNKKVFYPDSYVGSYYTDPKPDIMKPLNISNCI